jgi:hypothetical protein
MPSRSLFAAHQDKRAAFMKWVRDEAAKALQRPFPAARKKKEIEGMVEEMLTLLSNKELADKLKGKITQGIVNAMPRTASDDRAMYEALVQMATAVDRAGDEYSEAASVLKWLAKGLMDPEPGFEFDNYTDDLSRAQKHVDQGNREFSKALQFEKRLASRVASAYTNGMRTETGYIPGMITQRAPAEGVGSQMPPARDRNGKHLDVPGQGMMKIPGYDWHDKSIAFHKLR